MSVLHSSNIINPFQDANPFRNEALSVSPIEWKTGKLSYEDFLAFENTLEKYPQLKDLDFEARKKFFIEKKSELQRDFEKYARERRGKEEQLKHVKAKKAVLDKLFTLNNSGLQIQRPNGSLFRKMRKDFAEDRTMYLGKYFYEVTPKVDFEKELFRFAEVLLIEHDWASAFKSADLGNASVKLPYDVCAFEFNFSGHPIITLATQFDDDIAFCPIVLIDDLWCVPDFAFTLSLGSLTNSDRDIGFLSLIDKVKTQIRAACISLDAEVAKAEVVREPHTGQHGRNAHQMLKPYHVVSLARRGPRPLASVSTETGRRVRLHFRRGHWRHFEAHKTWIKWCLCGDPDLGFIDKHYKL